MKALKSPASKPSRTFALAPDILGRASFSRCKTYRYSLERWWNERLPPVIFVGLNPSKADAMRDDPTVRRCSDFARAWGGGGLVMLNLFAFRATLPQDMKAHPEPVGPRNDEFIRKYARKDGLMVAAWGMHGEHLQRSTHLIQMVGGSQRLHCLGLTKAGHPRHPLYLRADYQPEPFPVRETHLG